MVWTSDLPPVEVGGDTLHQMVLKSTAAHGPRIALVDGSTGQCITYSELDDRIRRVASALMARGYGDGDVLALCIPNIPPTAGVMLGALAAGMTVTMSSPAYTERELGHHVSATRAKMLVTIPPLAPIALKVAAETGVPEVVVIGEADGCTSIYELLSVEPARTLPEVDENATAIIFQSSGTTSMPKGVELSHLNLVTMMRQQVPCLKIAQSDTMLAVSPVFHIMGFQAMLIGPLLAGAKVVMMPRFEPQLFIELMERHQVTALIGAPPMMPVMLSEQAKGRFGSLELLGCGGSALARDIEVALRAQFSHATVAQGWGLTETTGALAIPRRGQETPVGSVGKLIPNTQLRVVDPVSGRDMGAGEYGELWVKGPQVMRGYLDNPEATAAMVDSDGWLHTGDLGQVDEEGCVYLTCRLKELIKVNSYQVAPAELEGLLVSHPAVADAAVVGRPDEVRGEAPVAFVVKRGDVSAEELKSWLAEQVTPYKRVRDVRFIDAIPKSPAGKILRRLLV